jgi:hypothetical protein
MGHSSEPAPKYFAAVFAVLHGARHRGLGPKQGLA